MRAEVDVPVEQRYLQLYTRVSPCRFERERDVAVDWCSEHQARLSDADKQALKDLGTLDLSSSHGRYQAFIQVHCYADIPPGRIYDTVFELTNPDSCCSTIARLHTAIFWRRLPVNRLEHAHHHLVVFEFPNGVPYLMECLPVDLFDGGATSTKLGLCDEMTLQAMRGI